MGTIGIFGGGQLGRMSAIAARRLGLGVVIFDPDASCPAATVADDHIRAKYEDTESLREFARRVDVATCEFENIPISALETTSEICRVAPEPRVLGICQNRSLEKEFLHANGFPVTDFRVVSNGAEFRQAVEDLGFPCILKTAQFGYDGHGQHRLLSNEDVDRTLFNAPPYILEAWVDWQLELSVVCSRNNRGQSAVFPVFENHHHAQILDITVAPARIDASISQQAVSIAQEIAETLDVIGLLTVEFFLTQSGRLLVNELAPRPHNSAHLTIEACDVSQFEQHVRSTANLPLGSTALRSSAAMLNLLGDLWSKGAPDWDPILSLPATMLHLYGKKAALPRRKMGHITCCAETPDDAFARVASIKQQLCEWRSS